ncbi:MAG: hypothetical protein ACK5OB_18750 [Pirellula sp.]
MNRVRFLAAFALSISSGTIFAQELPQAATAVSVPLSPESVVADVARSVQGNELNQNQWIRMTAEGSIRGSVVSVANGLHSPLNKVSVKLVRDGATLAEDATDIDGDFMIEKVDAGVYGLVIQAPNQLALLSLTVLDSESGSHLPERIQVRTIEPASPRIAELIRSNTVPQTTEAAVVVSDPIAADRAFLNTCEIAIDAQGGISGRLSLPNAKVDLSKTLVYLTREGREVLRTRALANGQYRFEGVVPGHYGLVASGPEGIAAIGFCAIAEEVAVTKRPAVRFVSQDLAQDAPVPVGGVAKQLNVELAPTDCLTPVTTIPVEEAIVDNGCFTPMMACGCGGAAAGYGGGGGGGGGIGASSNFGSLATLGAIGALAAVAVAQSDNNSSANVSTIQ